MKTYRKTATVEAKIFEKGDEDGFLFELPFIRTLENNRHGGKFGEHYLCIGIDQEKWLVEKSIFERTYTEVTNESNKQSIFNRILNWFKLKCPDCKSPLYQEERSWFNKINIYHCTKCKKLWI